MNKRTRNKKLNGILSRKKFVKKFLSATLTGAFLISSSIYAEKTINASALKYSEVAQQISDEMASEIESCIFKKCGEKYIKTLISNVFKIKSQEKVGRSTNTVYKVDYNYLKENVKKIKKACFKEIEEIEKKSVKKYEEKNSDFVIKFDKVTSKIDIDKLILDGTKKILAKGLLIDLPDDEDDEVVITIYKGNILKCFVEDFINKENKYFYFNLDSNCEDYYFASNDLLNIKIKKENDYFCFELKENVKEEYENIFKSLISRFSLFNFPYFRKSKFDILKVTNNCVIFGKLSKIKKNLKGELKDWFESRESVVFLKSLQKYKKNITENFKYFKLLKEEIRGIFEERKHKINKKEKNSCSSYLNFINEFEVEAKSFIKDVDKLYSNISSISSISFISSEKTEFLENLEKIDKESIDVKEKIKKYEAFKEKIKSIKKSFKTLKNKFLNLKQKKNENFSFIESYILKLKKKYNENLYYQNQNNQLNNKNGHHHHHYDYYNNN
ncbi:MAG: hypothetical protein LBT82_01960 [Oscillospiraceae bacterium]|jgi:hypothetical protein|nr:hypothetical protein [Oscillospiraceae bacterium]